MMRGTPFFLTLLLAALGCASGPGQPSERLNELALLRTPVSYEVVESSTGGDSGVEALVGPYRERMGEEIKEVIGETTGLLSKASPEGTLGNFATDAMLWAANAASSHQVHMALTNNGGLRVPVGAGPITVGQMFELMPFENMLSVLVLSGSQVKVLCDQLANARGEPIAGFRFHIASEGDRRWAEEIRIGDEPLDSEAEYRLVTNDYLASGGGDLTPLHSPVAREDLNVLLRDAFIDFVRDRGVIEPELEGRITGGIGR